MLASTAPKETFLDYDLEVYLAEIQGFLLRAVDAKAQLRLLWDNEEYCASDVAICIRKEHKIRDDILRQSLKSTAINSLYSILDDNQSKCFARLLKLHKKGPLAQVLVGLYQPLWEDYKSYYKQEFLRLAVNRNNYYAHVSRDKTTNEILSWDKVHGKHSILNHSDVTGIASGSIFSDQSLDYLQGLCSLLNFAQETEIHLSMVNDIDGHLAELRKMHPLKIEN